ncbi:hypothetical protein VP01_2812g1 [Puccinia sorghi]|uniref:Uncharacterized protein n=1 Tax=Puccinia sorghi TaxID=27349 RepID=A0A0L6V2E8_9BASI|nr:hypothetical protein VP01_2812g1 [Puccinia sorghi]
MTFHQENSAADIFLSINHPINTSLLLSLNVFIIHSLSYIHSLVPTHSLSQLSTLILIIQKKSLITSNGSKKVGKTLIILTSQIYPVAYGRGNTSFYVEYSGFVASIPPEFCFLIVLNHIHLLFCVLMIIFPYFLRSDSLFGNEKSELKKIQPRIRLKTLRIMNSDNSDIDLEASALAPPAKCTREEKNNSIDKATILNPSEKTMDQRLTFVSKFLSDDENSSGSQKHDSIVLAGEFISWNCLSYFIHSFIQYFFFYPLHYWFSQIPQNCELNLSVFVSLSLIKQNLAPILIIFSLFCFLAKKNILINLDCFRSSLENEEQSNCSCQNFIYVSSCYAVRGGSSGFLFPLPKTELSESLYSLKIPSIDSCFYMNFQRKQNVYWNLTSFIESGRFHSGVLFEKIGTKFQDQLRVGATSKISIVRLKFSVVRMFKYDCCYDLLTPSGTFQGFPQLGDYLQPPHLFTFPTDLLPPLPPSPCCSTATGLFLQPDPLSISPQPPFTDWPTVSGHSDGCQCITDCSPCPCLSSCCRLIARSLPLLSTAVDASLTAAPPLFPITRHPLLFPNHPPICLPPPNPFCLPPHRFSAINPLPPPAYFYFPLPPPFPTTTPMIRLGYTVAGMPVSYSPFNISHPLTQPQPLSLSPLSNSATLPPFHPVPPTPGHFVTPTTPPHLALETLQQTQAHLDATAGQRNPAPARSSSNPIVLTKPQPFDGTQGVCQPDWPPCYHLPRALPHQCQKSGVCRLVYEGLFSNLVSAVPTRSSNGNRWSLMTSSMISNSASLITTAGTMPRWPCGTARLELSQPQGENPARRCGILKCLKINNNI